MNRKKTHVRKGDEVLVISGAYRGKTGKILQVIREKDQVIVEGLRMIKKHMKASREHSEGAISEREGPIHISNVKRVESAKS